MNKKLRILCTLLFLSLTMQSCKNYYYLQHTPAVNDEEGNNIHTLKFAKENIQFVTFADYQINTVNKKYIFFTTKDVDDILKRNIKKTSSGQFLFMYTNMSIYNNLLGFYYENVTLEEIIKDYGTIADANMENGVLYTYNSGKFNVVDIYRKYDGGVVRFINVNNPEVEDPQNKKFHLEVRNLFFDLNKKLWDKNAADFQ